MVVATRKSSQLEPALGNWLGFTFTNRSWLPKPVGAILVRASKGQTLCLQVSFQPKKLRKGRERQTRRLVISHWLCRGPQETGFVTSIYSQEISKKKESSRTCVGLRHRFKNTIPHLHLTGSRQPASQTAQLII